MWLHWNVALRCCWDLERRKRSFSRYLKPAPLYSFRCTLTPQRRMRARNARISNRSFVERFARSEDARLSRRGHRHPLIGSAGDDFANIYRATDRSDFIPSTSRISHALWYCCDRDETSSYRTAQRKQQRSPRYARTLMEPHPWGMPHQGL